MATTQPRRYSRPPSRVAVHAARKLGLKPSSVDQLLHGHSPIVERYEAIVEASIAVGNFQLLTQLTAGVHALLAGRAVPRFDDTLIHQIQTADLAEDQAESSYLAKPSRDALREWLARAREQYLTTGDAIRAMERHLETVL